MSNLCPGVRGEGVHLFRLICLVVPWTGRDTPNTAGMWRGVEGEEVAHSGGTTPESLQPKAVYTPQVHTAQALVCSRRPLSKVGRRFVHFPGPRYLGSRVLHRDTDPGGLYICSLPRSKTIQVARYSASTLSLVGCASCAPPRSKLPCFLGAPQRHCPKCAMRLLREADPGL